MRERQTCTYEMVYSTVTLNCAEHRNREQVREDERNKIKWQWISNYSHPSGVPHLLTYTLIFDASLYKKRVQVSQFCIVHC